MNLATITGAFERNKKTLAIAGAAGVAGLALMKNRQSAGDPAGAARAAGQTPTNGTPTGAAISGYAAPYSSTESDLYNAFQPQLDALAKLVESTKSPIPVPAAAPQFADGLYGVAGGPGGVYWYDSVANTRDYLAPKEVQGMGDQLGNIKYLPINHSLWTKATLVGGEAPNARSWWTGKPGEPKV